MEHTTKAKLKQRAYFNLTVGGLQAFIKEHNLPENAPVVIQRIEDIYYKKHGWDVYPKPGEFGMDEYTMASCCVYYPDDADVLFINLHY